MPYIRRAFPRMTGFVFRPADPGRGKLKFEHLRRGLAASIAHMMEFTLINPITDSLPATYAQGALVTGAQRLLFLSGQAPRTADGIVPESFEEQCRLAWRNVLAVLAKADMSVANLAKVTIYLSDRKYREENARIRREVLGDHCPSLMYVITDIWDESWLLEIEAVAVA